MHRADSRETGVDVIEAVQGLRCPTCRAASEPALSWVPACILIECLHETPTEIIDCPP